MPTEPSTAMLPRRLSTRTRVCTLLALAAGTTLAQGQNQIVSTTFPTTPFSLLRLTTVAPGEILTLTTTSLGVPDAVATGAPLPRSLSGVSVLVRVVGANDASGYPASLPILRIRTVNLAQLQPSGAPCSALPGPTPVLCSYSQVTVQIPTERVCALSIDDLDLRETCANAVFHNLPPILVLNVKANGVTGPDMPLQVSDGSPQAPVAVTRHYLNSCDSIFGQQSSSSCHPLVTHADGSLVSDDNPAKVGETISFYYVGGESTSTTGPPTGSAPAAPLGVFDGGVTFSYLVSGSAFLPSPTTTITQIGVPANWTGMVPGYVGLYQVNVAVPPFPATVNPCGRTYPYQPGNVQIINADSPTYICVQP